MTAPHYLYRCYDAAGRLLYIGCTTNPRRRLALHRSSQRTRASRLLQRYMASCQVDADVYPSEAAGRDAERVAIRAEQPLFNVQHRGVPGWLIEPDIRRYANGEPTRDWFAYLETLDRGAA